MKFRYTLPIVTLAIFILSAALAVDIPDVTFKTKEVGKVIFSHRTHLKQQGLKDNCKSCHKTIYDLRKKATFTMADMEKGKSCGACHNGKKAFPVSECAKCHVVRDVVFAVKETGPTRFSHSLHGAIYDCRQCHVKLYQAGPNKRTTMAQMEKGASCGACHNGKGAFGISECTKCHPVKEIDFKVKETGPTRFSHRVHGAIFDCRKCHDKLYLPSSKNTRISMAEMEKGKSCGACHNGKDASAISECAKCHPVKEIDFKVKDAGNVKFSHTAHTGMYSCGECHDKLYQPSSKNARISMAEMEKGKSCGACHNAGTAFTVKENCDRCHKM